MGQGGGRLRGGMRRCPANSDPADELGCAAAMEDGCMGGTVGDREERRWEEPAGCGLWYGFRERTTRKTRFALPLVQLMWRYHQKDSGTWRY